MPPTVTTPSIPVPNANNVVQVLSAIRNYIISQANLDAGQSDQTGTLHANTNSAPQPSQFLVTNVVFRDVTFTTANNDTVTIPVLVSISWTNQANNQIITYAAPGAATSGGTVGATI
jgi:hypothetical protein